MKYCIKKVESKINVDDEIINKLYDFYTENFAKISSVTIRCGTAVADCSDKYNLSVLNVDIGSSVDIFVNSETESLSEKIAILFVKFFEGKFLSDVDVDIETIDTEPWLIMYDQLLEQRREIDRQISNLRKQMDALNINYKRKK